METIEWPRTLTSRLGVSAMQWFCPLRVRFLLAALLDLEMIELKTVTAADQL